MKIALAPLALVALLTTGPMNSVYAASNSAYVETRETLSQTGLTGPVPISNLFITLPAETKEFNAAIVTLNMPNLYLTLANGGTAPMSGLVQIVSPFSPVGVISAEGSIGCDTKGITASGYKPISLVLEIPLGASTQDVEAEWWSTTGDTINSNTFGSLSAIYVRR